MIDSIQESYIKQVIEQGRVIRSSEDRYYLSFFTWKDTVEGEIFWAILYYSYSMYLVYDYETIIKIYTRFGYIPNKIIAIYDIYYDYFNKKKSTLTSEGFEYLIKKIENAE